MCHRERAYPKGSLGTLADLDTEFLHDLRVSMGRARSVLRELKHVHDPAARSWWRDELKRAQQLTRAVRDLDVQLLEWHDLVGLLPVERALELEPLRALLARAPARARADEAGCAGSPASLRARARRVAHAAGRTRMARTRRAASKPWPVSGSSKKTAAGRDGNPNDDSSPPEALHDLRKCAARSCAICSSCSAVRSRRAWSSRLLSTLKGPPGGYRRFQDRAVQIELLQELRDELAAEPGGPAALTAAGAALDMLASHPACGARGVRGELRRLRRRQHSASSSATPSRRHEGCTLLLDQGRRRQDV